MDETQVLQLLSALGVPLFSTGAILFFWLMRRPWRRCQRYIARGGTASGVVVGHVVRGETDSGHQMYSLLVEFRDRTGRTFRTVSLSAATHPSPVGTQVSVAYDVSDPNRADLPGGARTLAIAGTGLAALFAFLAASSGVAFVVLLL